jgi:hypothetical protein
MYYNLICILYALLCGQKNYFSKKWVLQLEVWGRDTQGHTTGNGSIGVMHHQILRQFLDATPGQGSASATSMSAAPCGALLAPSTSMANATAHHRWATETNKV